MSELLGLAMYAGQIIGIIVLFGGWKTIPTRLRITCGVMQILFIVAMVGLTLE